MSTEVVKNLAAIQVIKTSANWVIFGANFDESSWEGGHKDHLVLQDWLPSARAASQPNPWHGREH